MSVETVSLFLALLALVALAGALGGAIVAFTNRGRDDTELSRTVRDLSRLALPAAWTVAIVCTLGSLYMSEIAKFKPCMLCWFQRIAMYPLVLLLGIATFRRDRDIRIYVMAQAGIGAAIAAYHSWIQAFPPVGGTSFCTVDAPCTERYVWELGFVSIPFMALSGFLFILAMMALAGLGRRAPETAEPLVSSVPAADK